MKSLADSIVQLAVLCIKLRRINYDSATVNISFFIQLKKHSISEWYFPKNHEIGSCDVRKVNKPCTSQLSKWKLCCDSPYPDWLIRSKFWLRVSEKFACRFPTILVDNPWAKRTFQFKNFLPCSNGIGFCYLCTVYLEIQMMIQVI